MNANTAPRAMISSCPLRSRAANFRQGRRQRAKTRPPGADDRRLRVAVEGSELPRGSAPEGEDERRGGDAEPRDAEHVHPREEQDRERGAKVVEDRAPDEVGLRRDWPDVAELGCGGFSDEGIVAY